MTCEELVRYLSDDIDRDLDREPRADADAHLASCPNCTIVLDTVRDLVSLFRHGDRDVLPIDRKTALYVRLHAALGGEAQ